MDLTMTVFCFSACWVVLCFLNPLNSDKDYRIFMGNLGLWSHPKDFCVAQN